jgi:hypothetical protein
MVERLAQRAGVLDACRERGIEGLLKVRSVGAAVGTALSLAYGETFEGWVNTSDDSVDVLHVPAAAATAEIFVTNNQRMHLAIGRLAFDGLRVMNLAEFLTACSAADEVD